VTGLLEAALGWRSTLLLYAAIHLLACAPIHLLILPRRPPSIRTRGRAGRRGGVSRPTTWPRLPAAVDQPRLRRLRLHRRAAADDRDAARPRPSARLGPAARLVIGPAQVGIRIFELLFGHRYSIMRSAVFGSLMLPVGLGLALLAGDVFVVRPVRRGGLRHVERAQGGAARDPAARLFGRAQFGAYMGRLALPQGIVAAVAPPIMAAVLSRFGTAGALWLSFAFAMVSLVAMVLLAAAAARCAEQADKNTQFDTNARKRTEGDDRNAVQLTIQRR
jgi:hypothetical protein